ncbi:hypothetical protein M0805_005218 [Coniferiporia weirii]|nr:hypothetical protein M0805_005218 [Coniferiporia weirii]
MNNHQVEFSEFCDPDSPSDVRQDPDLTRPQGNNGYTTAFTVTLRRPFLFASELLRQASESRVRSQQSLVPNTTSTGHPDTFPLADGRNNPQDEAVSTSLISESLENSLHKVLSKLGHLDLTGRVVLVSAVAKAHGGYCDIFIGNFSPIYPGHAWKVKVAIKRLRILLYDDRMFTKLLAKEMHVWSKLDHPNVLPFIGYIIENGYPSLVSEWIENGTVTTYLKENPETDIGVIILGIAEGLNYLHSQNVVHSDLKPDNVLIGRSGQPLICDFGISRIVTPSQTVTVSSVYSGSIRGSIRWMSIELFGIDSSNNPVHTKASDVWAYGMTVYEILARQKPYAHLKADRQVMFAIIRGELPSRPELTSTQSLALETFWTICTDCWKAEPSQRITLDEIVSRLGPSFCPPDHLEPFGRSQDSQAPQRRPSMDVVPAFGMFLNLRSNVSTQPINPVSEASILPRPYDSTPDPNSNGSALVVRPSSQGESRRNTKTKSVNLSTNSSTSGSSRSQLHPRKDGILQSQGPEDACSEMGSQYTNSVHIDAQIHTSPPTASPFLAKGSSDLISFDLRLPPAYARKRVNGKEWENLDNHDLMQLACNPPRECMTIFLRARLNWTIKARVNAKRVSNQKYVTVEDVLNAIYGMLNRCIDSEILDRDRRDTQIMDSVGSAYCMRVGKLESMRIASLDELRKRGLLRVDFLGPQWCFAGLSFDYVDYKSEWWWGMDVRRPGQF